MKHKIQIATGLAVLSIAFAAQAQKPIVYPAKGQSAAQQSKDDSQCYSWARQNTGIDPAAVASAPVPQETGPAVGGGERVRGSLRGAAGGAAIGAIAGGGKGAAIGAGAGGAAGAGTVLATRGKPAALPSETRITFRLAAPVTLTERK